MSDVRLRCPSCGSRYKLKALAKKLAKLPCPSCGNLIPIPKDKAEKRGFLRTIQATIMPSPGEVRPDLAEIVQAAVPGAVVFKKRKRKKPQPHHAAVQSVPLTSAGTYGLGSAELEERAEAERLAAARKERESFLAAAEAASEQRTVTPVAHEFSRHEATTARKSNAVLDPPSTKKVKDLRHLLAQKSDESGDVAIQVPPPPERREPPVERPATKSLGRIKPRRVTSEEVGKAKVDAPSDPPTIDVDVDSEVLVEAQEIAPPPAPGSSPASPAPPPEHAVRPKPAAPVAPIEEVSESAEESEFEEEALQLNALGYAVVAVFGLAVLGGAIGVGYLVVSVL